MAQRRFETQLEPIIGTAYRIALNMSGNQDDAADIVQESALRAFRSFHTFQDGTNFKAWFFRIVTNFFLEWTRKRRREPFIEGDGEAYLDNLAPDMLPLEHMNPASVVRGRMEVEQVQAAISALPKEYRVVASLYFIDEMSYQEIAGIAGCPVGTVRSRLHRSRRLLKLSLRPLAVRRGILDAASA